MRYASVCAAIVLVAAVLAGCTAGPSARPAIIGAPGPAPAPTGSDDPAKRPVPPLDRSKQDQLAWQPCSADVRRNLAESNAPLGNAQCSTIAPRLGEDTVPSMMNAKISLLKAGTGAVPLLVLDDVDGEPGTVYAAKLAASLPPEMLRTFTLIGMDRRGTGDSDGLGCIPQQDRAAILGYDPAADKLDDLITAERDAVQQCQVDMENTLQSFDTYNTVRDIEMLRDKLGVGHLNGIGRGEGARLLAQYATRYPGHAGRMVFDGFPDPNAEIQDRYRTRADTAEQTFDAFADSCREDGCPLGADPRAALTALLGSLREKPLNSAGIRIGPGMAVNAVLTGLADKQRWPELAKAIAGARGGNGDGLAAFLRPLLQGNEDTGSRLDARMVTGCNDDEARLPPQQVGASVKEWRAKDPLFGAAFGQRLLLCLPWPPSSKAVGKPSDKLPPSLMLSTAHDPVTPQEGTQRVAQQIPAVVRVGWQGAGHGALGNSQCATEKASSYLVHATLPSSSTACPA